MLEIKLPSTNLFFVRFQVRVSFEKFVNLRYFDLLLFNLFDRWSHFRFDTVLKSTTAHCE